MVIKKFNHLESAQKIHASRGQCIVHAQQFLMSVLPFQFRRYCYFQKRSNFPFRPIVPWSSKNLIIWNQLKKIMQVEVNVLSMHTNFDGCHHSGFGDIATFKNGQISLSDHGLYIVHGHQKI